MRVYDYLVQVYAPSKFLQGTTLSSYRHTCREVGDLAIESINPDALHLYAKQLLNRGLSPHTVKGRMNVLCCIWRHAVERGMASPFTKPSSPKCPKVIIRATPADEVRRLIDHCGHLHGNLRRTSIPRSVFWPAFAAATYESALRTSDLLQLRWEPAGRWYLIQVKTRRPVTVDVGKETLRLIEKLAGVSPSLFDVGWNREWYCRGLSRIGKHLGISICPQQLRRSAASEAERLKPGSAWVILGHGSPATTQRWYIDESHAYADLPRPRIRWN
jgi:integrase